ncbi:MAG: tRNA (adenosine(37)-N6)-threonylcarbamoyltransferase complex dimerization subunit type 1 TsaB [Pseudomonadota bacterium]
MNSMILSLNTTLTQFSAALMGMDGRLVADFFISPDTGHFTHFMPTVDHLLSVSQSDLRDLRALAVATGPGSFTGLRVGLSVAKGFCQGLQIPLIGVSSLEALASQPVAADYPICPLIDSRKEEVFAALFRQDPKKGLIRVTEERSMRIEDLTSFIEGPTFFLGNDFSRQGPLLEKTLGSMALLAPPVLWSLRASAVGTVGLGHFHEGRFDDLQTLVPTYLRPPDIRPNSVPPLPEKEQQGAGRTE